MGFKVELQDARALRYCSRGLREVRAEKGIDWDKARAEGLDSDYLLSFDDDMLNKIVAQAEKRHAGQI